MREIAALCDHHDPQLDIVCLKVLHVVPLPPVRDAHTLREKDLEVAHVRERAEVVLEGRRAVVFLLADAIRRSARVAGWFDPERVVHVLPCQ